MIRRVLMTADAVGGVWNYSIDLCRYLSDQGIDVALATMGRPISDGQRYDANKIARLSLYESEYKLEWMPEPWTDLEEASRWLMSIQSEFQPDLLHLNAYSFGSLPWQAPILTVCHSCVCSWWQAVKGEMPPKEWNRYRCTVTAGLRSSNLVVAPTHAMLEEAERFYGPFNATQVIPNGRDLRNFVPVIDKSPFVFSAGRFWDEAKNLGTLMDASKAIPWPIYIAGESDGRTLPDSVVNLGQLFSAEMSGWMSRAAIYAAPARYEPFGLSILEAALSGCALVLGDIPSLRENWAGCAIFVDPDSPAELSNAIRLLIDDESLRHMLAKNARMKGLKFGLSKFGRTYLTAYEELVRSYAPAQAKAMLF